jgi:F0F1-type ATP synthase membrane subunit a
MRIRRVISLTVLLSFVLLALSGIVLFISPQGRVAYWAGWTLFGLTKDQYSAIHTTFMVLFITVGIWHIVLNWKPILGYLKNRSKRMRIITPESSVALLLALAFLVGPLGGLPPFRQFLDVGVEVKEAWEAL